MPDRHFLIAADEMVEYGQLALDVKVERPVRIECELVAIPNGIAIDRIGREELFLWLWCERCQHHAPLACAVPVILWGPDASSDKLRAGARCAAEKARP